MYNGAPPLVSIVIPAYNSAQFICEAVDSCLVQTYPNCEIIVVDDGSTDNTRALLEARYGERIRYLSQQNAGPSAARNRGIRAARGAFIQFCDADDQLLPAKIERCMEVFQQQPEVGVVYTRYQYVEADGKTPAPLSDPPLLSGDVFCDLLLSNGNAILTSATLVRRDALLEVGTFDERLRRTQDWDLFLRLASRYSYASIDEVLLLYRWHEHGLTKQAYHTAQGRLITIQKARHYPGRERCLDDEAYDRLEAGRHHVMAMVRWRMGDRGGARQSLREAIRLDPSHRAARWVYLVLSYAFPHRSITWVGWVYKQVKRLSGQGASDAPV
ncbi:MAG TPA: glycosyltransferase [Aggregatilineaceae bacterium]|jgi:glycosyltransferase involved in cell wall biosynthesis|nr:glycosyltransferase [Aggregatilineaceae bacterium]